LASVSVLQALSATMPELHGTTTVAAPTAAALRIPRDRDDMLLSLGGGQRVRLAGLRKLFWPALGITKGALLQYYVDVSHALLPHLARRAMVMKRYPNGAAGSYFFMKRAPSPRPPWVQTCAIHQAGGSVSDLPIVDSLGALAWVVNLGCIDLNPWYARCDDV